MTPTLVAVALLLLLPVVPAIDKTPIFIKVTNCYSNTAPEIYHTYVITGGILLGGMRNLQDSDKGFKFTYTENRDFGPFLESVNGLAGNMSEKTYWELLKKKSTENIRLNVGIGCYIPKANDTIILNFAKW